MTKEIARKKTQKLVNSLKARAGFNGFWDELDSDIQKEIEEEIIQILLEE